MTMKASKRHRLQGMAAALAELIRLHGCETEALDVLQGFGITFADLLTTGAAPMDLAELTAIEAVRARERIQLRRTKGWRMPANAVKVDRSTRWGNPFIVGEDGTPGECIALYRRLLAGETSATSSVPIERQVTARNYVRQHIEQLRGDDLACWCRPDNPCHAGMLLKLANGKEKP